MGGRAWRRLRRLAFVTGNLDLFARIEAKVAALKQKQAALIMASGFQANASVLQALFDRSVLGAEPLVFSDRLNHASIHFGCAASGARDPLPPSRRRPSRLRFWVNIKEMTGRNSS